ncbi:DNA polymerase III subunit epsilon [Thiomicrorhabdus lithotrophica]|uniref:DNA polymerase III subunit epsilon n=1 Tax=Thiomicrorhabdus lithotrophica TaxID=2949997 RepID=A0ABY8C833_9GAMM|nr:DNA polymerase III subunit epsilon [Thiomicrorhabdus lithotrophica]WEJ61707.1 DNA polymerase III subunit epsilon [Thiomicrorhabdus lithotrophica]
MRQIILDTETTGFEPHNGDRIIEIGAVEMFKRRLTNNNYHQYIYPERKVPQEAIEVHGITDEFLKDKPVFSKISDAFMEYVSGAELIIHNAPFDVGFINHELSLLADNKWGKIEDHCVITDSLKMARKTYPGQRNSLDALCKRLGIDNSNRTLHGALLDSEILADVYLTMTGGQTALLLNADGQNPEDSNDNRVAIQSDRPTLKVLKASDAEILLHKKKLEEISKESGEHQAW